mgnify:CR=1 FL=1
MGDMMMSRLTERISVQTPSVSRGSANVEIVTWSTTATVWAAIRERTGREPLLADRPVSIISYEVTVRAGLIVDHNCRLLWRTKTLQIDTVTPLPTGYITMRCTEVSI